MDETQAISVDYPVFGFDAEKLDRGIYPMEICIDANGEPETSGPDGIVFSIVGRGDTIRESKADAYALIDKVYVPNMRFRTDIGVRADEDYESLKRLGWLESRSIFKKRRFA